MKMAMVLFMLTLAVLALSTRVRARQHSVASFVINSKTKNRPPLVPSRRLRKIRSTTEEKERSPSKNDGEFEKTIESIPGKTPRSVQDGDDWMSASRTLGSLFLHQENSTRSENLDIFQDFLGKTAPSTENDDSSTHASDTSSSSSIGNSLTSILLKMKHQEEVNREEQNKFSSETIGDNDQENQSKSPSLSSSFQIDPVCSFLLLPA